VANEFKLLASHAKHRTVVVGCACVAAGGHGRTNGVQFQVA